jgi:hypothetical protein
MTNTIKNKFVKKLPFLNTVSIDNLKLGFQLFLPVAFCQYLKQIMSIVLRENVTLSKVEQLG